MLHYPTYGGPHNQAARLVEPMERRGWETLVALPMGADAAAARLADEGVRVRMVPLSRLRKSRDPRLLLNWLGKLISDAQRIQELIRAEGIDLVMFCGLVNPQPAIAAKRAHVPLVWQLVDTRMPKPARRALMPFVRRADAVMSTGMLVAAAHPGALRLGTRLISFYPPVDTMRFRPRGGQCLHARQELGIRNGASVIGNVSNVNPQKGHATFIRAAAELKRRLRDVQFVILGSTYAHHATYTNNLLKLARDHGLELGRDLIIKDPGSRVPELASAFDVFWLTSEPLSEGMPTVVEEAMALEIPVVSVDVGSVRELVSNDMTGIVVPSRDPIALCDATARLLASPEETRQMAVRGGERVRLLADPEVCADAHIRAFEAALEHAQRRPQRRSEALADGRSQSASH